MIKNTKNQKEDDTITVRKNLNLNEFEITLRDQNSGEKISHRLETPTKEKVLNYLYLLLKSISLDEDGYENIQVNTPLMPRILFSVKSLKDLYYRDHVQDLLRLGLDTLEDVNRLPSVPVERISDNPQSINEFYATPTRSNSAALLPPAPRRSSRLSRTDQENTDTNIQNTRYYNHLINNQRHNFFDHDA